MFEFFEECEFECEQLSDSRKNKIRASVLSRIKEGKPMKKSTVLRSVILAATAAAVGTLSLIGSADSVPASGLTASENGTVVAVEVTAPECAVISQVYDVTLSPEYEITSEDVVVRLLDNSGNYEVKITECVKEGLEGIQNLIYEAEGEIFEIDGMMVKMIAEKAGDMNLIGVDDDGTRHYESVYGGTFSHWSADGIDDDDTWGTAVYVRID